MIELIGVAASMALIYFATTHCFLRDFRKYFGTERRAMLFYRVIWTLLTIIFILSLLSRMR